jgi:signal transduction histidine kinase/CheY-like chemotaxis protein
MGQERILVVDDEPTVRRACVRALTRRDYDVYAVESGPDALALLRAQPFDLLLTDIKMPGMDGLELLRLAREIDPSLLAVILTGYGTVENCTTSIQLGVSGFVAKPFTLQDLAETIANAFDKARLQRENVRLKTLELTYQARREAEQERLQLAQERAARAAAEAGQQRLQFLAEASHRLASSLDYATTLRDIASLVVPRLADWCLVDVLHDDGAGQEVVLAHTDPPKEARARELARRLALLPQPLFRAPQVVHEQHSVLYPELPEPTALVARADPELEALLKEVGLTSYLRVPLEARGRSVGVLTLVTGDSGRRYDTDDLLLAEELGHRCGLAIDNAWLHQQAQHALSVRNEFLSVAAHELKTPVTSLRGYAQVLLRHFEQGKQLEEGVLQRALHTVDHQSVKLVRLVSQLLDVSRIEAGKLVLERTRVDLVALVRGLVEAARLAPGKHTLVLRAPAELFACVDALRFEQVVVNLLDNAVKYSPAGTQIDVELAAADRGTVRLSVRDRGIGIPPDRRHRIFDRFYQAHGQDALAGPSTGIGLGLYITRQIVELHGGHIAAEFPTDGGTRFVVALPSGLGEGPASGLGEGRPDAG